MNKCTTGSVVVPAILGMGESAAETPVPWKLLAKVRDYAGFRRADVAVVSPRKSGICTTVGGECLAIVGG